jgi:PHD/YefM family antitoxin component YafN of YafNO toxin-antitoxin module
MTRIMIKTTPHNLQVNLDALLDRIVADQLQVVVRRRGKKPVVMVPFGEWFAVQEALDLASSQGSVANAASSTEHEAVQPRTFPE